jgi:predicted CXXCH cytochrome family protein
MARSRRGSGKNRGPFKPAVTAATIAVAGTKAIRTSSRWASRRAIVAVGAVAAAAVIGGLAFAAASGGLDALRGVALQPPAPIFVGSTVCAGCHRAQAALWQTSQHGHAMDHATDKTVLGDFSDATFDYDGVRSRFFREGGKFLVETDGPDGKLAVFEIKYTFGIDPLQQYLVAFPDGRLQALSLAWDSRPRTQGGQHWFHLYPNEDIKHDDILHWTKLNQNWNSMCAECHSTGVRKNYDAATDRFHTTWAEISVGCEACHGPGTRHVAWARDQRSWRSFATPGKSVGLLVRFDERSDIVWRTAPTTGEPRRNIAPPVLRKEVETCGLCHARRAAFSEDWVPGRSLSDTHAVALLQRGLYSADGQMLDEVYNYGPFKQSKMFAAGVTCSDCHDPHSGKLKIAGDGLCLQCHAPDRYANAAHNHHAAVEPAVTCASCHMPTRTYMVVDRRHDHSFRIPRPDVSARLGMPNACNDCHADKTAAWAAAAVEHWYGPDREGFQNYAEAFHTAWNDEADAAKLLAVVAANKDTPAFARASALTELVPHLSSATIELARNALSDPDPMVRIGALDILAGAPAAETWPLASPLLADQSRGVRIRAASLLAPVPTANQPAADRENFERAATEFVAAQRLNADRPESRAALGTFFARRRRFTDAETEYQAALGLSPHYAPAAANLADLYRQLGRDPDGEHVLRAALLVSPQDAGLHHALGLTLVRRGRRDQALDELRRAAELDPGEARYAYVYAVALHSLGRSADAVAVLKDNLARHPNDRDTAAALIAFGSGH